MVNQKYYSTQHQLGKILNVEMLSPWFKKPGSSAKDFCRIMNEDVDLKVTCFFRMLLLI